MLPFTQEIVKTANAAALVYGATFESGLHHELVQLCIAQGLGPERKEQASVLRDAFTALRSEDFDVSYAATVNVMKLLYELSEVIPPEYFEAALRGDVDTALYRLFFQVKPAPTAVIVNDWLYDVMWNKPGSVITYSAGEGRFYLVRPNSLCRLSIEAQFLGSYHAVTDTWSQFKRIREVVRLGQRLYREGKQPATRGARMEAFKNW